MIFFAQAKIEIFVQEISSYKNIIKQIMALYCFTNEIYKLSIIAHVGHFMHKTFIRVIQPILSLHSVWKGSYTISDLKLIGGL